MIAAIILAAGKSSRMGECNKLLMPGRDGTAMVRRVAGACRGSRAGHIVLVLGHEAAEVHAAVPELNVVVAEDYALGMSASLRAGISALPPQTRAALVCLGDMPLVTSATMDRLIGAHEDGLTIVPFHRGQRGNPVLWDRGAFPSLLKLRGDTGARSLLNFAATRAIEVDDSGVLLDFDTADDLLAGNGF